MSEINISPLHDRIVIKRMEEKKTAGGIVIPDTISDKSQRGVVKAVSKFEDSEKKQQLKVGDIVLFGKYSGTEIDINGNEYLIMKEEDIMAVVIN